MANSIQDENPIICIDEATGKPLNYYWLNNAHFAEQFPHKWAHSQLPNTGTECSVCMVKGSWAGVVIGYCRQCANLYRDSGDDRGPGFRNVGIEYDETDPTSANMTYMANVPWEKVGKTEHLEEQLRQYYYNQAYNELTTKIEKSDRKIWCKRDALGGEKPMKLAQLEKQLKIRQKTQKKQMGQSIEIECCIYATLLNNEIARLSGYKTDIKIIDKSVKMIEATIGSYYSDQTLWDGHTLTRLGHENMQEMIQKIKHLLHKKRKIEQNMNRDELERIDSYMTCLINDSYMTCLRNGDLMSESFIRHPCCLPTPLYPEANEENLSNSPSFSYNHFIDINEWHIEELEKKIKLELGQK